MSCCGPLLWNLNRTCMRPQIPEPHSLTIHSPGGQDNPRNPDTFRPGRGAWGKARAKGPLGKGWNLNSILANFGHQRFLFFTLGDFSLATEPLSNLLEHFSHKRESDFHRRKWFFPILVFGHLPLESVLLFCVVRVSMHFREFLPCS